MREYKDNDEFEYIPAIIRHLHRHVIGESSLDKVDFFRPEGELVAIPGKENNENIVEGIDVGLRVFCYKPNNKTLVYLNGYHHDGIMGDYRRHPNFAHKSPRIMQAVHALILGEKMGYVHLDPNGGYYEDRRFQKLITRKEEFDLTEYLK